MVEKEDEAHINASGEAKCSISTMADSAGKSSMDLTGSEFGIPLLPDLEMSGAFKVPRSQS